MPSASEALAHGPADAARPAGDDRDPSGERVHHASSSVGLQVVVALVDERQQPVRRHPADDLAPLDARRSASVMLDEPPHRKVGDGIEP